MKLSKLVNDLNSALQKHGDVKVEVGFDNGSNICTHGSSFVVDEWSDGPGLPVHTVAITMHPTVPVN